MSYLQTIAFCNCQNSTQNENGYLKFKCQNFRILPENKVMIAQPFEKLFNGYPYKIQKKKKRISFDGEEEFSHDNNEELTEVYN